MFVLSLQQKVCREDTLNKIDDFFSASLKLCQRSYKLTRQVLLELDALVNFVLVLEFRLIAVE